MSLFPITAAPVAVPDLAAPPFPSIVAINGSERPDGNTGLVLAHASTEAASRHVRFEVIDLATESLLPCGTCGDCNNRPVPCEVDDGMAAIVDRLIAADGVIYVCPVHGFGMASTMQRFIERAGVGYLRFERPLANKVAGIIVTGRRYAHGEVHAQLVHNVLLNRMLLAGSGFPTVVHAGARGEALGDHEGIDSVTRMVHRMIDLIELLREHRALTGRSLATPADNERARL